MIQLLYRFFAANRELCTKIESSLPQAQVKLVCLYDELVGQYANMSPDQIVVDVGGGRQCTFADYRDRAQNAKVVAVDISEEELKHNTDADEKRIANVAESLPFERGEVDIIASRMVLEHLESVEGFVAESERSLKKEGYSIHLFPSKFAPFTLINQALPNALSKKLLGFLRPKGGGSGFPSFYDNCCYSDIHKLLEKYDFQIVEAHLSYYQSRYFGFFVPLYLLSALYEMLIQALGAKDLCAYVLVVAQKRGDTSQ